MIPENQSHQTLSDTYARGAVHAGGYLDWGAILAGAVLAIAVSSLLVSFGASLGLSLTSPYRGEGVSAGWLAIAAGLWFAWVTITAFGAGGYLAGRMRRRVDDANADEVTVRDGANGLMVWGTGVLVGAVLAAFGAAGLVSVGTSAAGTATTLAAEAASTDYFGNLLFRTGPDAAVSGAGTTLGTGAGTSTAQGQGQTESMIVDPEVVQEMIGIITRGASAGGVADRDRTYMAQLVAANTGLDNDAATARVDEVLAEIDSMRQAALEAAETARVNGVVFGFIAAATLLIGAAAAALSAAAGGRHRDEGMGRWTH